MKYLYSFLIVFFMFYTIKNVYSLDSLGEHSLKYVDLEPYKGPLEQQKYRFGMYTNEISLGENFSIKDYPKDLKAYKIWHILPHWPADEAGLYIGDTLIGMNGKPIYDANSRGDVYMELELRNKKEGDLVTLTTLKNGKQVDHKVKLFGLKTEKMPFIDPGLGPIRQNTWLQGQIAQFGLNDWVTEIQKQMYIVGNSDFNKVPFTDRNNPWRLNAVTYLHNNPSRLGAYSRLIVNDLWNGLETGRGLSKVLQAAGKHLDLPQVNFSLPKLPKNINDLNFYFYSIQRELNIAYSKINNIPFLTGELIKLLQMDKNWEEDIDTLKDEMAKKDLRGKKEKELAAIFSQADNVDFFALLNAGMFLSALIDSSWAENFAKNIINDNNEIWKTHVEGVEGDVLYYWETPEGRCVIGGRGPNRYTGDFCFIMDIGGNDVYELPPARQGGFRFIIDIGGNDLYQNTESGQGAGIGCLDVLFDLKGNDTYRSAYYSQGAGLLGIGILADFDGDDIYTSHWCSQGAAFLGIGLLFDKRGSDNYFADIYSQGFGYSKGFGVILEQEGNDSYKAGWKWKDDRDPKRAHLSMSQGFGYGMRPWTLGVGADGGIGVLADFSGHDVYNADFFSQGGSYWYSLGILYDRKGCDRYTAGQYSQGSGIHLSFGALLDDEGNDMYDAYAGLEQGNAHDLSAGCLEDYEGNDTYRGFGSSQGSALTVALAWLLDTQGDDIYVINPLDTTLSEGGGSYNDPRKAGSLGLLIDLGKGNDTYTEPRAEQGKAILKGRKGILFDDGKK